jgi:hypothetical protein
MGRRLLSGHRRRSAFALGKLFLALDDLVAPR